MNNYRVTFYNGHRVVAVNDRLKIDHATLWVAANNDHHAIAEATTLALVTTECEPAEVIGQWLRDGKVTNVYAVIETN